MVCMIKRIEKLKKKKDERAFLIIDMSKLRFDVNMSDEKFHAGVTLSNLLFSFLFKIH